MTIIGLNPSTADGTHDDPTIRRCTGLARNWGYGGFLLVNLFSWRSPHPAELKQQVNAIGPRTNHVIRRSIDRTDSVLVMWGNHGEHLSRDKAVLRQLGNIPLWCVGQTATGAPKHLLYARNDVVLQPFSV